MLFRIWSALLCLLALGLFAFIATQAQGACSSAWDDTFRKANRTLMPAPLKGEWRWHKDQALIESDCRPDVCSHVGACGLLQVMPGTWRDLERQARTSGSVFEPKLNIILATRYSAWLSRQWLGRPRTAWEIWELQLGRVQRRPSARARQSSRLRRGPDMGWIAPCLPDVTGRHSAETIGYVRKANRLRR